MSEGNQDTNFSERLYCPVFKHKIHCSQLEETEASLLPEEKWHDFCLNKCPTYKRHKGNNKKGVTQNG